LNRQGAANPAIHWYEQAIAGGYRAAEVYSNLAYSHQISSAAQYEKAIENYTQAIAVKSDFRVAYWGRAEAAFLLAQQAGADVPPSALKDAETAAAMRPGRAEVSFTAAYLHLLVGGSDPGHRSSATKHVTQALELGLDPKQVRNSRYFQFLLSDPHMQSLLNRPAADRNMIQEPRLLDPIVD
jgi:hypothetical protein